MSPIDYLNDVSVMGVVSCKHNTSCPYATNIKSLSKGIQPLFGCADWPRAPVGPGPQPCDLPLRLCAGECSDRR